MSCHTCQNLYGGSVSDNEVTTSCGFLDKVEEGDSIMADKGFQVIDIHVEGKKEIDPSFDIL